MARMVMIENRKSRANSFSLNSMPAKKDLHNFLHRLKGTKQRLVDRMNLKQHYRREIYSPFKTMFCKICSFLYITLHLN